MFLLNGESKHLIDVRDRGFQYGDGVFETIRVANGDPLFQSEHLARLELGCQRLKIKMPDKSLLRDELAQLLAESSSSAILKIILTRGIGGRGYRFPEHPQTTRLLSVHAMPDYPQHFYNQGIKTLICRHRLGLNSYFAGIKHLNRLEQIMARSEWCEQDDIQEGIMLDLSGRVVEGTMTNIFFVAEKQLFTPSIKDSGVAGIIRQWVIDIAQQQGITVTEGGFYVEQLLHADEIFVTNSVIGIWPVARVDKTVFTVGSITQQFQRIYQQYLS